MDDAWPEHLEGLQIPGNFHKSRDVVPYSAWNVHEVVAYELQPGTQFKTKPLQHFRTYTFLLAASISINKALISTRKLARTAMSTWSFWDVLRKNEKLISSQQPGVLLENRMFPQLLQHYHHDSAWFCLVWQKRGLRIQIRFARVRCCALVCKILWIKTSYSRSFRRRMQTERPWWPV